jgi:hypothetical protein
MRSWSAERESAMSAKCCVRGRTVCSALVTGSLVSADDVTGDAALGADLNPVRTSPHPDSVAIDDLRAESTLLSASLALILGSLAPPFDVGRQGLTQLGGIVDRQVDLECLPIEAELDDLGGFRSVSVVNQPGQDFGSHVDSSPPQLQIIEMLGREALN